MGLKAGRVGIHPSQVDPITGMLLNGPTPGSISFEDLSDVQITDPEDGDYLMYDSENSKWINSGEAPAPTYTDITVTMYGAVEDTISFTDAAGISHTEVFASGQSSKSVTFKINPSGSTSITFTSAVAKDPDDLTADYSKSVTITSATTEIKVMPDNSLYWWGYVGDNCESISTVNGWSGTFNAPTYNTNNVYCYANNNLSGGGIGTKNKVSGASILHFIGLGTFSGSYGGNIAYSSTKAIEQNTKQNVETTLAHTTLSIPSGSYYFTADSQVNNASRSITVSALWYE